jgi:hypothetical protein
MSSRLRPVKRFRQRSRFACWQLGKAAMSTLTYRLDSLIDDGVEPAARQQRREWWTRRNRLYVIAACLAPLPAGLPAVSDALLRPIQARFERAALEQRQDIAGFIALGGGDERIREAARLTRMYPQAKLVITGHGPAAVRLAQESGLPAHRVIIEGKAQNTYENAVFTAQLVQPNARKSDPGYVRITYAARHRLLP